jgi:hypothetical protein
MILDSAREIKEEKNMGELFRATLGFDFIFSSIDGNKIPLCIEINGEDTGLKAVENIPEGDLAEDERERVRIRMTHTKERIKLSAYAESLDLGSQSEDRKEAWAKARNVHGFVYAFQNPAYIREIAGKDKKLQQDLIPSANRPLAYQEGKSPISRSGFWICKPIAGRKGQGIRIVSNEDFEDSFIKKGLNNKYIAQELVKACGAEKALPSMKENPAALRLLIDFVYFKDNSVKEVFTFAYQRISQFSVKERATLSTSLEEIYVVNFARGAKAAAASEFEFQSAHAVALKIIHNIAAHIEISKN